MANEQINKLNNWILDWKKLTVDRGYEAALPFFASHDEVAKELLKRGSVKDLETLPEYYYLKIQYLEDLIRKSKRFSWFKSLLNK